MQTKKQLDDQFALPGALRFEETPSGLVHAIIKTEEADADVYLQGAHLAGWEPAERQPVLFLSRCSEFLPGKAIRGGVPVIFPWFGPRGGGLPGPSHGLVRMAQWRLTASEEFDGNVGLVFDLEDKDVADRFGYGDFALQLKVTIGTELEIELRVSNRDTEPLRFEEALHSYFAISDIGQVAITGLEGTTYIDKTDGMRRKQAGEAPMRIAKETDQVHLNTQTICKIEDLGWEREIVIEKSGSNSTVVWNPWIEKTRTLRDMDSDEWRKMICVESGNVGDDAVTLEPGKTHVLSVVVRIEG